MADETGFVQWPALQQVFKLERKDTYGRSQAVTEETVYGITSLSPEPATRYRKQPGKRLRVLYNEYSSCSTLASQGALHCRALYVNSINRTFQVSI
jgi:hypothetical protein